MGQKLYLNEDVMRLVVFLHNNNLKRYKYSELHEMRFFKDRRTLSRQLKMLLDHSLVKKTAIGTNGKRYALYEIRAWANGFAEYLKQFI